MAGRFNCGLRPGTTAPHGLGQRYGRAHRAVAGREGSGGTPRPALARVRHVQAFDHLDKADTFDVDETVSAADPAAYDALVLPGGVANPDALRTDEGAVDFVRAFVASGKPVAAICHAPWTLIEAGVAARPHAHLVAEPADRHPQRRRHLGRRGGRRRRQPGHQPQPRRPARLQRQARRARGGRLTAVRTHQEGGACHGTMARVSDGGKAPQRRRVPQQVRSRDRVERILEVAGELVVAGGVEAVTTRAIAAAAEIPVASLYQYFADKESILLALVERDLAEMERRSPRTWRRLPMLSVRHDGGDHDARVREGLPPSPVVRGDLVSAGRTNPAIRDYCRRHNQQMAHDLFQ